MASEGKTKKMRLGVGMHPNALLMLIFVPTAVVLEDGPLDPRAQNARVSKLRLYECVLPSLQSALDGRRSEVDWHAQDNVAFTPAAHPSSRRLPRLDQSGVYVNCERLFDGARPEPDGWSWDAHSWSADHDSTDFQKEPSAERAKQHEAMEHIYDFLPVKLCGHACALNVPWKITCCGCDGVLPAHELVRKQRQDIRRHWVSQACDAAQASCDDRDEDKRAPGDGIPSGALAASRGLTAELQRILAPFLPLIPQGRRIYNFLADDGAAEEETEKHDQNQARQHSGKLWSGRRRPPHAAFCWVCRLVDKLPPVFVALQALVSSSLPLRPCPPMLCFPGARGEQRERADTGEECECGDTLETPSGHATWSFSSHPRVMLPVVEESIWERAMARAGEVMGPWWLLRVLEPSSAQSLPHPVRACAGRDAVWFNICFAEGLVTRDLRPRVPFNSVLDGGLEWRDVGGDLDSGLFLHASADRGLFRQDSLPPSLPVWLHVYLESTQAQAAVKNVVDAWQEDKLRELEESLPIALPYHVRLLYSHFDGQDEHAPIGILRGLRMLSLEQVVSKYQDEQEDAPLLYHDCDLVSSRERLVLSEQSGFQRYLCAASTGAVWMEGGFNLHLVCDSLAQFLAQQPGSQVRGNLQRGERQRQKQYLRRDALRSTFVLH